MLAAAVAVALLAQFVLDAWAEQSSFLHWIQHGLIFWSGLVAGAALAAWSEDPSRFSKIMVQVQSG